jgi:hypothetical protein
MEGSGLTPAARQPRKRLAKARKARAVPPLFSEGRNAMAREYNAWDKTFYHRAIQTKIGQGLREQYDQDLARPLPHNLFTLVMQLGGQQEREPGEWPGWKKPDR